MNLADDLERLHALHMQGAMTADEYQQAKDRLLADGPAAEPANDEPFAWKNVATPTSTGPPPSSFPPKPEPNPLAGIGGAALGSWMVGLLVCLLAKTEIVPTAVVAAVGGTIAWAVVSAASAATARSPGLVGAMLLVKGAMAAAFVLAAVAVIGMKLSSLVNKPEPPSEPPRVFQKAKIN